MSLAQGVQRGLFAVVGASLALLVLCFGLDYVVLRVRVATSRQPYGSVIVRRYYAVQQKNCKKQFIFDPPQPQTCGQSLFPHDGDLPCWYLARNPEQRTDM